MDPNLHQPVKKIYGRALKKRDRFLFISDAIQASPIGMLTHGR